MIPLDLKLYAAQEHLTWPQLKQRLCQRVEEGSFYSRFNPEELEEDDIYPMVPVNTQEPFQAGALELVPFPVLMHQYDALRERNEAVFLKALAGIKASFCLAGGQANPKDQLFVEEQLRQFYDLNHPHRRGQICWIDLDPTKAPYQPLVESIFVTVERHRIPSQSKKVILPIYENQGEVFIEAWETPEPDEYGFRFIFLTKKEPEGNLVTAAILEQTDKNEVWFSLYNLSPKLYTRTKKHLFSLLGSRLQPKPSVQKSQPTGRFRGRVYRK